MPAMPNDKEKAAWNLRKQGLKDAQVGHTLGIKRETANRRIGRFRRKFNAIRKYCAETGNNSLLHLFDDQTVGQVA